MWGCLLILNMSALCRTRNWVPHLRMLELVVGNDSIRQGWRQPSAIHEAMQKARSARKGGGECEKKCELAPASVMQVLDCQQWATHKASLSSKRLCTFWGEKMLHVDTFDTQWHWLPHAVQIVRVHGSSQFSQPSSISGSLVG